MRYNKLLKLIIFGAIILTSSAFSLAADISTDAKLQYNKGIDYYKLGQLEESVKCFKNAIELDPNYIDAYYNLGSILEYMKQDEAAVAVFKQIVLRKPDDYESVYKTAVLCKKLGDIEKAKMYLGLIPKDSMTGQKAKALADSLGTDLATIKSEQKIAQNPEKPVVNNTSNQVYENIDSPTGIASDKDGNIFVAGFSDNTIYKISPENKKIVYIKSPKIDGPLGIAMDTNGSLYIANYNKNNVLKVDKYGTITEFISNVQNPYCLYISNNLLFVSSQGSNSVVRQKL